MVCFFCGYGSTRIGVNMLSKFLPKMSVRKTRAQTVFSNIITGEVLSLL